MADKTYKIGWFSTGRDEVAGQLLKVIYDNIKKKKLKNPARFPWDHREEPDEDLS